MIDKSFLEKIEEMTAQKTVEIDGLKYSTKQLHAIKPPQDKPIQVSSLSGFIAACDIVSKDTSGEPWWIGVLENCVQLISKRCDNWGQRDVYVHAQHNSSNHKWGHWHDSEMFRIWLLTSFMPSNDLEMLLQATAKISDDSTEISEDDGISQKITIKTGLNILGNAKTKGIISLKPFRTFLEIDQPESLFVFRMKKVNGEINYALHEGDGGLWKANAVRSIIDFISPKLPGVTIVW
jgi:hypothetical protein